MQALSPFLQSVQNGSAANNQNPSQNPSVQTTDAAPYIAALFAADGRLRLAAERLSITPEEMILAIAKDPNAQGLFDSYLRVYSSLKAFEMLGEATLTLTAKVADLEPFQAARHFTNLLTVIDSITKRAPQHNTINLFEAALKQLPPDIQDALKILQQPEVLTDEQQVQQILNYDQMSKGEED